MRHQNNGEGEIIIKPFDTCAFYPADILIPKDADMTQWSVVACDQYTSEPEYWDETERIVGGAPSTLRLTLPEIYLEDEFEGRIDAINAAMRDYLGKGLFTEFPASFVYLERKLPGGGIRHGLVGMLDLDAYDYTPGSKALARATEGTVLDRLPPRVKIRENAPMELPHVMVLIDDPNRTVIEPLEGAKDSLPKLYDFELMQNGGHATGYRVAGGLAEKAGEALGALTGKNGFLYAIGDGNHSLASAKSFYERLKKTLTAEEAAKHPARFALCELVNIYDNSLTFEPIHRVLFGADMETLKAELLKNGEFSAESGASWFELLGEKGRCMLYTKTTPAVGPLQVFLDKYIDLTGAKIDYIHGDDVTIRLGTAPGNTGILLPAIEKDDFFGSIARGGVFPRKTFSMGEAHEKRYYLECRRIT
jgi:hypothetical protein